MRPQIECVWHSEVILWGQSRPHMLSELCKAAHVTNSVRDLHCRDDESPKCERMSLFICFSYLTVHKNNCLFTRCYSDDCEALESGFFVCSAQQIWSQQAVRCTKCHCCSIDYEELAFRGLWVRGGGGGTGSRLSFNVDLQDVFSGRQGMISEQKWCITCDGIWGKLYPYFHHNAFTYFTY